MTRRIITGAIAVALIATAAPALAASAFGCRNLEQNPTLPSVEGKDGFFFRVFADLRMQHPMTDEVTAMMGKLAATLKANGTTLIYTPIPTKSVTLPAYLPDEAKLFGFDTAVATKVYEDQIQRLTDSGVIAVDLLSKLRTDDGEHAPFFRSDFHWTATGARQAAEAVGGLIKSLPAYADVTPVQYETRPIGNELAVSGMRRTLQAFCAKSLPPVVSDAYETVEVASADASLDIFGSASGADAGPADEVALVGTSFSDAQVPNFSGFLAQYASLPVANMAITGGNQFGAITSYLTSREFQAARPKFLVWENPIYNNLAQYGTAPLVELVAAARNDCTAVTGKTQVIADKGILQADLSTATLGEQQVLLADAGDDGSRDVIVDFSAKDGRVFRREIHRGDRFRATGRFFIPLESLDTLDLSSVSIKFDRLSEKTASASLCTL